ncbi:hypothetical protein H1Q63_36720 [Desmonostoc muscorum CCALA 125]|nr:hypothetical protein [Desmonostoc muscorum CCALA 125]
MNNENSETTNDFPQPDPVWDYYIEWHKLIRAKAQLEKVIEFISKVENATEDATEILQRDIAILIDTLGSV